MTQSATNYDVSPKPSKPPEVVSRKASLLVQAAEEARQTVRSAATDRDAEWQRVNSYIADILKDAHVLYSKIARLQGDFVGNERDKLENVGEQVLDLGGEISKFMRGFHAGKNDMLSSKTFGEETPCPEPPCPPELKVEGEADFQVEGTPPKTEEDFEADVDLEGEEEFEDFEAGKEE